MARSITEDMLAALAGGTARPVLFFEGEFASGFIRVWTGVGAIAWNGETWQGVGQLAGVSPITETAGVRATGITVSLSGVPAALIPTVYTEARQGKPGRLWVGALAADGTVIADPIQSFVGKLDVPVDRDDGDTATISITYESRLIDLERPRERRYTPEDQHIDYPDDKGFDFVAGMQDIQVIWGRS